jgi:ABC-type transport system involved in multi-copper enzyme maturation permease subunit
MLSLSKTSMLYPFIFSILTQIFLGWKQPSSNTVNLFEMRLFLKKFPLPVRRLILKRSLDQPPITIHRICGDRVQLFWMRLDLTVGTKCRSETMVEQWRRHEEPDMIKYIIFSSQSDLRSSKQLILYILICYFLSNLKIKDI